MTTLDLSEFSTVLSDNFAADSSLDWTKFPIVWGNADDFSFGADGLTLTSRASEGWAATGFMTADFGGNSGYGYGLYQATAKLNAGEGIGPCVNLWPADNVWPGAEIDLLESTDPSRQSGFYTIHWRQSDGSDGYWSQPIQLDLTQFHNFALDWEPGTLTYYIDGQQIYSTSDPILQPPGNEAFGAGVSAAWVSPTSDTVSMTIQSLSYSEKLASAPAPAPAPPAAAAPAPAAAPAATPAAPAADGLAVSAAVKGNTLVISGDKELGQNWTTKWALDGTYRGTLIDNQADGAFTADLPLPSPGTHDVTVMLADTSTSVTASVTVPGGDGNAAAATPQSGSAGALQLSASVQNGALSLSGDKEYGQNWTTKWWLDGSYQGTLNDNQADGQFSDTLALPKPGAHSITVTLDGTGTSASVNFTVPGAGETASVTQSSTWSGSSPSFASTGNANAGTGQTLWTAPGVDTLVGGAGSDTLFVDCASPDGWASVLNFGAQDTLALVGLDWNIGSAHWVNGTDPAGRSGATLDVDLTGSGHVDAAVTLVGVSLATAEGFAMNAGSVSGQPFLAVHG